MASLRESTIDSDVKMPGSCTYTFDGRGDRECVNVITRHALMSDLGLLQHEMPGHLEIYDTGFYFVSPLRR